MSALTDRFDAIIERFTLALARSGRKPGEASLVAVSKWHGADRVAELALHWFSRVSAGPVCFGESYMQEGRDKMPEVSALLEGRAMARGMVRWHFIGHVQSRKARDIAGCYDLVHSVDSLKLARALDKAWHERRESRLLAPGEEPAGPQAILLQVNVGHEAQKSGVAPEDLPGLLDEVQALPGLCVQGLMCLPPPAQHPDDTRPYFAQLRALREAAKARSGLALAHLSMGMSDDFEAALEEGATLVRIGTDIFGPRPAAGSVLPQK